MTDEIGPADQVAASGEVARRPRLSVTRRTAAMMTAAVLLLGLVIAAVVVPVPYVTLGPGPTFNTIGSYDDEPLITVSGAETFPTDGRLDLTTVSESGGPYGRLGLAEALRGWIDPDVAVVPSKLLYPPGTSEAEVERVNECEFAGSESAATVAALREVGEPVTRVVEVTEIEAGSPADGEFRCGDAIVAVGGERTTTPEQVVSAIRALEPGDDVTVTVRRNGREKDVTVTTQERNDDGESRAAVGVSVDVGYTSPVRVEYSLEGVGGPSAGLMFALGLVDKLTKGSLTGGAHVAGTGTIDDRGAVGPIGGIQQKLQGARSAGATVFLVPAENCEAARGAVPEGLRLVKVSTLSGAVDALDSIRAGGPAPTC